jgi:glycosyltransferase involved in cell wall biosynthesis
MDDLMNILHVPCAYAPVRGGAELVCQRVSEELAAQGHRVRVLTSDVASVESYYRPAPSRIRPGRETRNGVEVRRLRFGGRFHAACAKVCGHPAAPFGLRNRVAGRVLARARAGFFAALERSIRALAPDVVVALPHLVVNVQGVLAANAAGTFPLVLAPMLHEDDPNWPARDVAEALRRADAVLALTEHEAGRLRTHYAVPAERLFVCGVGVDIPPSGEQRPRRRQVVYLGRKVPEKNIAELIAAMRLVWEKRPETELVLAGARSPATREIDRLIEALPAEPRRRVVSLDDLTEGEKHRVLSSSCCLVLPSRHESFGIALLEAWARGTPVVAPDLPVFRCVVTPDKDGLLTAPGDVAALAAAVEALLSDEGRARALGEAGLAAVRERYTWESVARRCLRAYEHAVAHHCKP